jgi:hypothetical protein
MVIHTCEKCGKTFNQKTNYLNHTKLKKVPCNWKNVEETLRLLITSNNSNNSNNSENINKNDKVEDDKKIYKKHIKEDNELKCYDCGKVYSRKDNLIRHKKSFCKKKYTEEKNGIYNDELLEKEDIDNKEELTDKEKYDLLKKEFDILKANQEKLMDLLLKKENEEATKNNINNTNNNTNCNNTNNGQINSNNQTNTNNINIFQFGKEDYSKIPDSIILKAIMSSTGAGIPCNIIEKLHFNNDFPEFKNICITDKNRKHALFWNGNKWIRRKYENLGTDMLDRCLYLISDRMDDLEKLVVDKKTFGIKKKALDKLENVNSDDEAEDTDEDEKITIKKTNDRQKFRKQASDIIENLLYDNRDVICKI